jgi:hypothetical protein
MPYFDARIPVINGKAAEPQNAKPVMSAMLPVTSQLGKIRVVWLTRMGNMGPRRNPMDVT